MQPLTPRAALWSDVIYNDVSSGVFDNTSGGSGTQLQTVPLCQQVLLLSHWMCRELILNNLMLCLKAKPKQV